MERHGALRMPEGHHIIDMNPLISLLDGTTVRYLDK